MNTEIFRKDLPDFSDKKSIYSRKQWKEILDSSIQVIKNRKKSWNESDEADRWLVDNYDFIYSMRKNIDVKRFCFRRCFADFLFQAVLSAEFTGSKESVQILLHDAEKSFGLKEKELAFLQDVFFLTISERLPMR